MAPTIMINLLLIVFLPSIKWFSFLVPNYNTENRHHYTRRLIKTSHIMIDCGGTIRDKLDKVNLYSNPKSTFSRFFRNLYVEFIYAKMS